MDVAIFGLHLSPLEEELHCMYKNKCVGDMQNLSLNIFRFLLYWIIV